MANFIVRQSSMWLGRGADFEGNKAGEASRNSAQQEELLEQHSEEEEETG